MNLSPGVKKGIAILVPEAAFAPVAALGTVYCASKFAPGQLGWLTQVVSKNIVEPHIKFFDSLGGSIQHAHEKHQQQKREEMLARGEKWEDVTKTPSTPKERADIISEILVKGSLAMAADLSATMVGQHVLNKALKADLAVKKTAFREFTLHLGGIIFMPTIFAGFSENVNHGISKKLRSMFGISKDRAEDLSIPYTYVTLPGQAAALVALAIAHGGAKGMSH